MNMTSDSDEEGSGLSGTPISSSSSLISVRILSFLWNVSESNLLTLDLSSLMISSSFKALASSSSHYQLWKEFSFSLHQYVSCFDCSSTNPRFLLSVDFWLLHDELQPGRSINSFFLLLFPFHLLFIFSFFLFFNPPSALSSLSPEIHHLP